MMLDVLASLAIGVCVFRLIGCFVPRPCEREAEPVPEAVAEPEPAVVAG